MKYLMEFSIDHDSYAIVNNLLDTLLSRMVGAAEQPFLKFALQEMGQENLTFLHVVAGKDRYEDILEIVTDDPGKGSGWEEREKILWVGIGNCSLAMVVGLLPWFFGLLIGSIWFFGCGYCLVDYMFFESIC
ncbi:unnamed protein product [Fraxinus pennsylvanica]|uniref:Uncharacterized protein n=1 Tax=Fraxinus pennsylvanica TaxID=56036 RepID=A0AAD1ZN35_9LAMI|nr:unnamed protein product [Fraxinus pennsylvanica]